MVIISDGVQTVDGCGTGGCSVCVNNGFSTGKTETKRSI